MSNSVAGSWPCLSALSAARVLGSSVGAAEGSSLARALPLTSKRLPELELRANTGFALLELSSESVTASASADEARLTSLLAARGAVSKTALGDGLAGLLGTVGFKDNLIFSRPPAPLAAVGFAAPPSPPLVAAVSLEVEVEAAAAAAPRIESPLSAAMSLPVGAMAGVRYAAALRRVLAARLTGQRRQAAEVELTW